jgi:putative transposase
MLARQFPKLEVMLRESAEELLAFTSFPLSHWKGSGPPIRWNDSIRDQAPYRCRGGVPQPRGAASPAGAVLIEVHDGQVSDRR